MHVPYVSQLGQTANRYHNDCGVACVLMVAQYLNKAVDVTVNALSWRSRLKGSDKGLTPSDLIQLLGSYQIKSEAKHSLTLEALRQEIDSKRPVILLVNYKYFSGKSFGHYVVLVGYTDTHFIVHDPYLRGKDFSLPIDTFEKSITDVHRFFYFNRQGVLLLSDID